MYIILQLILQMSIIMNEKVEYFYNFFAVKDASKIIL